MHSEIKIFLNADYRGVLIHCSIKKKKKTVKHCFVMATTKIYSTNDVLKNSAISAISSSKVVATTASHCVKYVVICLSQLCE